MTYKEKQRYLESYIYNKRKVLSLTDEFEQWMTIATSITQKLSPVTTHSNDVSSKIENCVIKCNEIEQEILKELGLAEDNRIKVLKAIDTLKDTRHRDILTRRYINNVPVRKIAIELDKDTNSVYKVIRTGIKSIDIDI